MLPPSPVQGKHSPVSKVDIVLLLMLQLVDGNCGESGKFLPEDHLEPKVRGPGEQGSGKPLEDTIRRRKGTQSSSWEASGRPQQTAPSSLGHWRPLSMNLKLLGQRCNT